VRVLFLAESFHPVLGGGERHIRALGAALVASGFQVTVVARRAEARWPREEVLDGLRVVRVGPAGPSRTGKYAMVPAAVRALFREGFDLLVVRGTRVLGLPGLLVARSLGRPAVLQAEIIGELSGEAYTWGTPLDARPWRALVRVLVRGRNLLLRDAEGFVAMSAAIRDEFLGAGLPAERVHLIPHGVDTSRFRPASLEERGALRRRLGWPEGATVAIYTGRLLRGKGLQGLLRAFRRVAAADPRALLVLVGSGDGQALSVEEALRSAVPDLELAGRVVFTGRVDDVSDHLRASDLFVFPSEFEALGLSLIEAAACGLPAVASRTGGIVDVVEEGGSGLLVPPGDEERLADALLRLAADEERRRTLGRRGRELAVAGFDHRANVARYRELFSELGAGRKRPGG
jgi:glycosyltransferase involved in cell wall biosynthesis